MPNLTQLPEWNALQRHFDAIQHKHLREMFTENPHRFEELSLQLKDILVDFSKNRITTETVSLLTNLAKATNVEAKRDAMFAGELINSTEGRAVLHTALRNRSQKPVITGGKDVMPDVLEVLGRMKKFAEEIRTGKRKGYTGLPFSDVVNIGIGGSDLGPKMVVEALKSYGRSPFGNRGLNVHFVSNVDGTHIAENQFCPLIAPVSMRSILMLVMIAALSLVAMPLVYAQPRLVTPPNATLVADSLIRLRWNPLSDVSRYEVAIGWDSLFTLPTVQTLSATQNTLTIRRTSLPYVPAELTAFWRVRVRLDSVNVGAWSEVWRFTMPVPKTVPPIVANQIQDKQLLVPTGQSPIEDRIELESPQWRPGHEEGSGYVFIDPNPNKQSIPTSNTAISSRTGMSYTAISENPKRVSVRVNMRDATVVNGAINPRPTLYYTVASSDNCQTAILVKVIATNLAGWTYPCFFQVIPRFGIGFTPVSSRQAGLILQAVDRFSFGQMPINQSTIASVPILTSSTATSGFLSVQATPGAEYSLSSTGTWQPSLRVDWRSGQPKLERLWLRYTPSIGQNFPLIRYVVSDSCDDRQFRIEAIGMPPVSYAYTITSARETESITPPLLEAVYPNPTSSDVTFALSLSKASRVRLTVCTTLGSILQTVADAPLPEGRHSMTWQSVGLPSGVYGYRLEVDGASVQSGFVSVVR